MFAAAMLYSCPNLTLSIYSTCKRISQMLLRNVNKFLNLIYSELHIDKFPEIRVNMEEIVLKGPETDQDIRTVNSYPSKVTRPRAPRGAAAAGTAPGLRPPWALPAGIAGRAGSGPRTGPAARATGRSAPP